jgi:predicted ATPase
VESGELMDRLIGPEALPPETRALILAKAEGNPYYIQELINALIAGGVLAREPETGRWRAVRTVTSLDLPDSLQQLLRARIDRLAPEQQHVLQVASVIGPVFWANVLRALTGEAPPLSAHLAALQHAQWIVEGAQVAELGKQYAFNSALIREAAYESLLNAQRAAYHRRVAEYLENLANPESLVGYYGMLAYHYRGAGNPRKELFYSLLAADQAKRLYANTEAVQRYNRAFELLDDMQAQTSDATRLYTLRTQRFELLRGRRDVLYQVGDLTGAAADSRALLSLARELGDDAAWMVDALLAQPELSTWNSREERVQGMQMAEQALALARQLGDRQREMESLVALARARYHLRDPRGLETAQQALALAGQLGDLRTEVSLLLDIGEDVYGVDDLTNNQKYLEAALAKSEQLDDKAIEIALLAALGRQFERQGDYYQQLTGYEQKRLRISREIGHRMMEGQALMFCGQIQALYLGDYEAGLALEQEALHIWENISSRRFPLLRIAQIYTAQGRSDEALAALEMAQPIEGQFLADLVRAGFGLVTAILYNTMGDEAHLRQAVEITSQIQQMVSENLVSRQYRMAAACEAAAAYLSLAQCVRDQAETHTHLVDALHASQAALDLYHTFGFVQVVECVSEEIFFRHSQALAANGRLTEAADFLQRAHDEMMRKHDLIPVGNAFRRTYLENIPLHRAIQAAHSAVPLNAPSVPERR